MLFEDKQTIIKYNNVVEENFRTVVVLDLVENTALKKAILR